MAWSDLPKYYLSLVTAPTAEPLSASDIKSQVNLSSSDVTDDGWIDVAVKAARQLVERQTRRSLLATTWDLVLEDFPVGDKTLVLPIAPLISSTGIASITYFDGANSSTTMPASDFNVHAPYDQPGFIVPLPDKTWPTSYTREDAVTVRFQSGFGTSSTDVPAAMRQACKMLIGHWYENRESVVVGTISTVVEQSFEALLGEYHWGMYS